MLDQSRKQAIVVGGGVAGLLAAAAFLKNDVDVTLLERDGAEATGAVRRGVPQGRHPHLLLAGGLLALRDLLPDIDSKLIAAGGLDYSASLDMRSEIPGVAMLPRTDLGIRSIALRRPVLEAVLAARLAGNPNFTRLSKTQAARVRIDVARNAVTGVDYFDQEASAGYKAADFVVDASGQGSLILTCLDRHGRAAPREEVVEVDIGYSSAVATIPIAHAPDFICLSLHPAKGSGRAGYMLRLAPEQWHIALVGRGPDQPPASTGELVGYAMTLGSMTLARSLLHATEFAEFARFRFPANVRRHFTSDGSVPRGLFPIGDAYCRFNPVFGQGMSVAAHEALILSNLLAQAAAGSFDGQDLTDGYIAACSPIIDRAWSASAIPDFAYPTTIGEPPANLDALLAGSMERLQEALRDRSALLDFFRTRHLVDLLPEHVQGSAPLHLAGIADEHEQAVQ